MTSDGGSAGIDNERDDSGRAPLAIVGIGCRFPGGVSDADSLWRLLIASVDAVGEVPPDRWELRRLYHSDVTIPGKTYARHGGFLAQSPYDFDASFFGLSAREAAVLDPQQRLLLETTWEAFEDAGYDCRQLRRRPVGVFIGGFSLDNLIDRFGIAGRDYISSSTATSSTMAMLSNRVSHAFDLVGPSLSIDTACSSSLVATHLACASLWSGQCEMAAAGGVNVMLAPEPFIAMAKGGFLSRKGRCQAFDEAADGYVRAEGAGVVVIRPLAAAIEAGDRIYARILATGVNQDGHTPGISMPNPHSQKSLIRRVLRESGLSPRQIVYAEAHGPGTQAGDPIEAESLGQELGAARAPDQPLWVGSIKTNIGHTEAAAGVAGLIKAALVLHHRAVPPNLHFHTPNPRIDLAGLGLRIPVEAQRLPPEKPLHAAVNSFGYGGTNAHAVLGTPPPQACVAVTEPDDVTERLYPISAGDEAALNDFAAALADMVPGISARDLGYSLSLRRTHHPERAAIWASADTLAASLRNLEGARSEGRAVVGRAPEQPLRLLFVFTGMGAQYVGMGRQLFATQPVFRAAIERCDALVRSIAGRPLLDRFTGTDGREPGTPIGAPSEAQVSNLALQVGLVELWRSLGVEPAGAVGHSVGEIAAAWAAGALTLEEALRLTCYWAEAFQRLAGLGSMMAVGLGPDEAATLVQGDGDISISAMLAPDSVVLGGPDAALDRAAARLAGTGTFHRRLHVDVAYHHAQVDTIKRDLQTRFGEVVCRSPTLPLYSTLLGARVEGVRHDAEYWWGSSRAPANFQGAITCALNDGFDAVLEIGPNRVLSAAVKSCASALGKSAWTGASMMRGREEAPQIRSTLAEMYVRGVPLRWEAQHSAGRFVRLPRYPWQRARLWAEAPETRVARSLDPAEPLLHQRLNNPTPAWQTDLSSAIFPYLRDHVVGGTPLFPAAGHIAVLLAASRALGRGNSAEGIRFDRALPLAPASCLRIDVEETSGMGVVSARGDHDATSQRHAGGRLGLSRAPRRTSIDLDAARHAMSRHMAAPELYAALAECQLSYGPQFRVLRDLWFGRDDVVASLALPADAVPTPPLHPALLDGAFQALAVVAPGSDGHGPLVPVSVEEVRLHGEIGSSAWVNAQVSERTPNSFTASLCLCDPQGKVLAEIDGLRCQRLPAADADLLARAASKTHGSP